MKHQTYSATKGEDDQMDNDWFTKGGNAWDYS
jgi:hypothetical protein